MIPRPLVVVDDLDVPRMTDLVAEADALRHRGRPRALAVGGQHAQADRLRLRAQVSSAAAAFSAANKSSAFSTSSPANLLLPSSANRRVALFAQDLIICHRTTCFVVRQCSQSGGAHVRPPSPSIPSEQRGTIVEAVADRVCCTFTLTTGYMSKKTFARVAANHVLRVAENRAQGLVIIAPLRKTACGPRPAGPGGPPGKAGQGARRRPRFAARPSPTYISVALKTGLEDLFDPLRARRDFRASLRL